MASLRLFRTASAVCRCLPLAAVPPLATLGGRIVAAAGRPDGRVYRLWARTGKAPGARRALGRQWRTVARHQQRAVGALGVRSSQGTDAVLPARAVRSAVRDAYASYARYWLESLRAPFLTPQAIESGFSFTGVEHAEAGLAAGNGIIFALPHLGCWDYAGSWLARARLRPAVVVEKLEPPEVFDWFRRLREDLGMEVIAADDDVAARVITALRANRSVCLPCERDLSGAGVEVTFFGERTTMPAGPAVLALRTGAALLPTAVYYDDSVGGHLGVILAPINTTRRGRLRDDVARITQELAGRLEDLIGLAPTQWHLFQPNWPSDRAAETPPPL